MVHTRMCIIYNCVQVIPVEYLRIFTPDQFSLLLSGIPTIDVDDWEQNTEVHIKCVAYRILEKFGRGKMW